MDSLRNQNLRRCRDGRSSTSSFIVHTWNGGENRGEKKDRSAFIYILTALNPLVYMDWLLLCWTRQCCRKSGLDRNPGVLRSAW